MLRLFPLILISVIAYNFLAFSDWAVHAVSHAFVHQQAAAAAASACTTNAMQCLLGSSITIPLMSGAWSFSVADLFVLVTLILLFVEIIKATRTTANEIINHGLSMLTFVIALIEFIIVHGFATSTFFFIMSMALFDVIAGYTISIVAAEHDLGLGRAGTD